MVDLCEQVRYPEQIRSMFRRIKSQVYELPELIEIARNPNWNDNQKFVLLKRIMEDFQNRYGINTSIYEFCRYKNVPIPKEFVEDQADTTTHMPILERMLKERLRNLDELLTISRNEKEFPEKNPTLKKQ